VGPVGVALQSGALASVVLAFAKEGRGKDQAAGRVLYVDYGSCTGGPAINYVRLQ